MPSASPAIAAENATEKTALRLALLAARAALDPADRALRNDAITHQLLAWWQAHPVTTLGVYWPLRGEADLSIGYAELAAHGVRLALPVVRERDAALDFADWQPGEEMVKDKMGVAVPAALRLVARPATLLVPCLGFNSGRYRLGYGGGYYDRTLAIAPRAYAIGIADASAQVEFAAAPHDVALDLILSA